MANLPLRPEENKPPPKGHAAEDVVPGRSMRSQEGQEGQEGQELEYLGTVLEHIGTLLECNLKSSEYSRKIKEVGWRCDLVSRTKKMVDSRMTGFDASIPLNSDHLFSLYSYNLLRDSTDLMPSLIIFAQCSRTQARLAGLVMHQRSQRRDD